jgi:hypothetical protein
MAGATYSSRTILEGTISILSRLVGGILFIPIRNNGNFNLIEDIRIESKKEMEMVHARFSPNEK